MALIHGICAPHTRGFDKVGGGGGGQICGVLPQCVAGGEVSDVGVSGGSS